MTSEKYCPVCKKNTIFTSGEIDYFLCSSCGFRTSFGKYKLIIGKCGYYVRETDGK